MYDAHDLNADRLAATDRPIIAFFDVDNTILRGASVYHVSKAAFRNRYIRVRDVLTFGWHQFRFVAVGENRKHIANAQERALGIGKGHKVDELRRLALGIYETEIEPRLFAEAVGIARDHLAKGHEVWLITAAPVDVAQVISEKLGLTGAIGTILAAENGLLTGELEGPILHGPLKAVAADEYLTERGAASADCWAYSDSHNDIPLLELVGNSVAVNPDAGMRAHATEKGWRVITIDPASVKAARRRVRRQGRVS